MAQPANHTRPLPPPKLRANLSFHFLWTSTFASGFADRLAMLAVGVMLGQGIKDQALEAVRLGDSAIVAGINFWFFLPYVLWGPFAGWLADRLPRKWLMFAADEARGLIILFAWFLLPPGADVADPQLVRGLYDTWLTLGPIELTQAWKIWLIMFLIGTFAATFSPARNSVIPNVVGYRALQRANSVVLGMGVIGNLIGFGVGGKLASDALSACILTSSICYFVPGWMWPFLKTPALRHVRTPKRPGGPGAALVEIARGGQYILKHRPLIALTAASILFWTGSHVILASGSAIAVDLYGGDVTDFAAIGGAFGLGMLVGALTLGFINSRVGGELIIVVAMVGVAVFLALLTVVPLLWVGIILAICCGLFGGMIMITVNTMTQMLTADGYRGRVMAFKDLASDLGGVAVSLAIWRMAEADKYVLYIADFFAAALVGSAVVGARRYVLKGPIADWRLNVCWRVARLYCQAFHRARYLGHHRVPRHGPVLLVAPHTAGVDPLLIQSALPRRVRWLMAGDMMIRPLGWFWKLLQIIEVQQGQADRTSARDAVAALKQGQIVGIFPEGGINREDAGLKPFAEGVGMIAGRSDAWIVPVAIDGTPRAASAYAALFKLSQSRVLFGQPFRASEVTDPDAGRSRRNAKLTQTIRDRVEATMRELAGRQ